jgi:hypothetical protein
VQQHHDRSVSWSGVADIEGQVIAAVLLHPSSMSHPFTKVPLRPQPRHASSGLGVPTRIHR